MNQKDIETLQKIFGGDRVFILNDKLAISRLPKWNGNVEKRVNCGKWVDGKPEQELKQGDSDD